MDGQVTGEHPIAPQIALPAGPELPDASACGGGESFALRVLGQSMAPEFAEGEIIVVEPDGHYGNGSYVLAWHGDEWTFRQLCRQGKSWVLHALNPAFPDVALTDLSAVHGVIIQKVLPGRRRSSKRYI